MSKPDCNVCASKDQVKPYYVYIHRRADDGRVFYVGKGKGWRAWQKYKRSIFWMNVEKKHGRTVHVVMRFSNEECAFSFERALISHYGRENLCNLTDGGDGVRGVIISDDQRRNHSIRMSGENHPQYGKPHSEEMKRKLSFIAKTNPRSIEARLKIQAMKRRKISCSNGMVFDSITDAVNFLRLTNPKASNSNVIACAKGKLNTAYR